MGEAYSYIAVPLTCAYLVLDVPHERSQTGRGGEVRVALHPTLKELFLLGILLKGEEELTNIILLLKHVGQKV